MSLEKYFDNFCDCSLKKIVVRVFFNQGFKKEFSVGLMQNYNILINQTIQLIPPFGHDKIFFSF